MGECRRGCLRELVSAWGVIVVWRCRVDRREVASPVREIEVVAVRGKVASGWVVRGVSDRGWESTGVGEVTEVVSSAANSGVSVSVVSQSGGVFMAAVVRNNLIGVCGRRRGVWEGWVVGIAFWSKKVYEPYGWLAVS